MAPGEVVQVQPPWEEAVFVVQPPEGYTGQRPRPSSSLAGRVLCKRMDSKLSPVKLSRGDLGGQPHVPSLHLAVCPQHLGLELSPCVETQVCSSARP